MNVFIHPERTKWKDLVARPEDDASAILEKVREIVGEVRRSGDEALTRFTKRFDAYEGSLRVSEEDMRAASNSVSLELQDAIVAAGKNIERFHAAQRTDDIKIETQPGVLCGTRKVPLEKVGIYVPGGTAPLFSTVMMLSIPARLAGCREIVMCTPPGADGTIHEAIFFCAAQFGVTSVFRVGGAQAIAAMAYGTETIPKVDKIFGPGNRYVTAAKMLAAADGVPIDMPAGPSEVAVIADAEADPEFVAADLLAQAEHGTDSQVILITDSKELVSSVREEIDRQLVNLPRREIAATALGNSRAVVLESVNAAVDFANQYAPEHLIVLTRDSESVSRQITNAGSIFIGEYSCESAGDYASGTNHTLPTNGFARSYSGVSLDSFQKQITYQKISRKGILSLGPVIETLAEAESLAAHKHAVTVRMRAAEISSRAMAGGNDDSV
ncbi:MAG: histidinol dehydrogenase [Acidobacteria bacterium]|mgnify:CR=1 FL=1|nr:MAG: histidinol dehydrogenase [Acidobacteriota bacterium]REK03002.1 MAG: histidinol dehydrogenase [Acidobacteriota bacterium]REK13194.1 MAG: histidinol dehydrogenase [Acidobacteriota bacterium]REK41188.1 MAG: histidinol dehydrogenase [Acidobacteriota bacterium]